MNSLVPLSEHFSIFDVYMCVAQNTLQFYRTKTWVASKMQQCFKKYESNLINALACKRGIKTRLDE